MNIIIPSLFTLFIASLVLYNITSRFSGYTIAILAFVSLIIILYNNVSMFGDEYKFFIDFFETFGGRLMLVVVIGGIIFIILGFISKMDVVKVQMQKVFASTKPYTNIPVERIMKIERQL
jgi:hypothetical protein